MATALAVVGPGRVGQALARRWREAGYRLLGFLGRTPAASAAAVAFAGGDVLASYGALSAAGVVVLAVPDAAIAGVAAAAARGGAVRPRALWLHVSGATGLDVLAAVEAVGARIGSLHPLSPFPTAAAGHALLPGRVAVIDGPRANQRLLGVLARRAGMQPLVLGATDRALYHAACALAANGSTVLCEIAARWFAAAAPQAAAKSAVMVDSLVRSSLAACLDLGAEAALTGPAARGDAATLRHHQRAVAGAALPGAAIFAALMREAAAMAQRRGVLAAADVRRVDAALDSLDSPNP